MISEQQVAEAVDTYLKSTTSMDAKTLAGILAEDVEIYDPVGTPAKSGEQIQEFCGLLAKVFAKLEVSQDHRVILSQQAAVKWTMKGQGKNGKEGTAEGISIFTVNEAGKIKQVSAYWHEAEMMSQIKD